MRRYGVSSEPFVHAMHGKYSIRRGTSRPGATPSRLTVFTRGEPVEDDQLRGRAQVGVHRAKLPLRHTVAVPRGDALGPGVALGAGPLEAVVAVAQARLANRLPMGVVLAVGRGDDDPARAGMLEDNSLHRRQPGRVEMLDHLHQRDGIEARQPLVAVE